LECKLFRYITLHKFTTRSKLLVIVDAMMRTIGRAAGDENFGKGAIAMDATGLETTTASAHFRYNRCEERRKCVEVSTVVLYGGLVPVGLVLDWGRTNDKCQAQALLTKANKAASSEKLYADTGNDAEWVHEQCWEQ
jgi:hypothetical protein